MVMLDILDLGGRYSIEESVSILVGPNGSGKSSFLRDLVLDQGYLRESMVVICNTPHDRFSGIRGVPRISVGKRGSSPKDIVKRAIVNSLEGSGAEFYQISTTMEYCGYRPSFCFRIDPGINYDLTFDSFLQMISDPNPDEYFLSVLDSFLPKTANDLIQALVFLKSHYPITPIWINADDNVVNFSRAREFINVMRIESILIKLKVIRGIRVYLERKDTGDVIEMHHASSGQLTLISSLLFLITNVRENPIIIIDEPENSLHPKWQREYVSQVLGALSYRNARVIIATHAPLVVTGALADNSNQVSVYELQGSVPKKIPIDIARGSTSSIEEILWHAFNVVTPSNHFVSEQLVDKINRFEKGEVSKKEILNMIQDLEAKSFDDRQMRFFNEVRKLLGDAKYISERSNDR